jgi:hypothetical protein
MTRLSPSRRCLSPLLAVLAACGGGESGGAGPQADGRLTVTATGLPDGYTAPFTVVRAGQTVAIDAVSGSVPRTYGGLLHGRCVVGWGNRTARVSGDTLTFAAAEDTVQVTASEPPPVATGEFAIITGGMEVIPTGAPSGVALFFQVWPPGGGPVFGSVAVIGAPRRLTNLAPGAYSLVFYEGPSLVDGEYRTAISPDTLLAAVRVGTALTPVAPVFLPRDAVIDVVVTGLPADLRAPWGYTNLAGSFSVGGLVPPGPARLFVPYGGDFVAEWGVVTARDTTWTAIYNPGPFTLVPSFTPIPGDTIRYAPQ